MIRRGILVHWRKQVRQSLGYNTRFIQDMAIMDKRLLDILVCPVSKGKLTLVGDELWCRQSGLAYPIRNDIPVMLESEARQLTLDEVESIKDKA